MYTLRSEIAELYLYCCISFAIKVKTCKTFSEYEHDGMQFMRGVSFVKDLQFDHVKETVGPSPDVRIIEVVHSFH